MTNRGYSWLCSPAMGHHKGCWGPNCGLSLISTCKADTVPLVPLLSPLDVCIAEFCSFALVVNVFFLLLALCFTWCCSFRYFRKCLSHWFVCFLHSQWRLYFPSLSSIYFSYKCWQHISSFSLFSGMLISSMFFFLIQFLSSSLLFCVKSCSFCHFLYGIKFYLHDIAI